MKYLLAAFLVFLSLQPPVLQACAMDDNQPGSHHTTMQHDGETDCCDVDRGDPAEGCDEAAQCAFFSFGFIAIPGAAGIVTAVPEQHYVQTDSAHDRGPPTQPPFRPPIA